MRWRSAGETAGPRTARLAIAVGVLLTMMGAQAVMADAVSIGTSDPLGPFLVDDAGRTLYLFLGDSPGRSTCEGGCIEQWPIVHFERLEPSTDLDARLFHEIERADGRLQSTYLGWPLYRFSGDGEPGEARGHGLGNQWFVVDPFDLDPLVADWMLVELTDARTGETFRVSDFYGTPVLLESFAVWCSVCLRQQREMAELLDSDGDAVVHVSLDTDPNEDVEAVRDHAAKHGFDWWFAVAPIEMTQRLIDAFGLTVLNAPRAPVVLIDVDGAARLLPAGVKGSDDLRAAVEAGA